MAKSYQPPFSITSTILNRVGKISEILGEMKAATAITQSPQLRKENRIKTVTGTLAIEGNTLSLDQVTGILEGKKVLGSVKEIAEVHGAIRAYENLNQFIPTHENDLLKAHAFLMGEVLKESGQYRKGGVGIHKNGKVIHVAPQANRVPQLIRNLLAWLKESEDHPLIKSSVFHYEFEFIHPFSDGNGRMGRLWQTLVLSKWNPIFENLPIESVIKEHQAGYYQALEKSDQLVESTPFVEFMLNIILEVLQDILNNTQHVPINAPKNIPINRQERIIKLIVEDKHITLDQLATTLEVSRKTIQRDIRTLKELGKIERIGSLKNGHWKIINTEI